MCSFSGNVCEGGEACINTIPDEAYVIIDYSKFYYDKDAGEFRPIEIPLVLLIHLIQLKQQQTEKVNECKLNQEYKVQPQPDKVEPSDYLVTNTKEPLSF